MNADSYVSTGQGVLGNNMYAYCRNNPVNRKDSMGKMDEVANGSPDEIAALIAALEALGITVEFMSLAGLLLLLPFLLTGDTDRRVIDDPIDVPAPNVVSPPSVPDVPAEPLSPPIIPAPPLDTVTPPIVAPKPFPPILVFPLTNPLLLKKSPVKIFDTPDTNPNKFNRLKNGQGFRDSDGNIWKVDQKHKDHWDVSDKKGNKIREISYDGRQIWPFGVKNKNKFWG